MRYRFAVRRLFLAGGLRWLLLALLLVPALSGADIPPPPSEGDHPVMAPKPDFTLEVLVDFLDDAAWADHPLTEKDIDGMMRVLAKAGVKRVGWAYYGDGHGGLLFPDFKDGACDWANVKATYRQLGNPLRVAVEAGHRHGLEVYAYYKPYETGVALVMPDGAPEAKDNGRLRHQGGFLCVLDPFVVDHPDLRIKRRTDDLPAGDMSEPLTVLKLYKRDDAPTRITREHLQIWTSPRNFQYKQLTTPFTFTETFEPAPRDIVDQHGVVITKRGASRRVLRLGGLQITDPYVLVTTDYLEGTPDFDNAGTAMLTALDKRGRVIPGEIATGGGVWLSRYVDFRQWGLIFDYGWGRSVVRLDESNLTGHHGLIAFARGKNAYLPAALCETEPAVRAYWLHCVDEMLAAGVDGIDIREENHSTHTDQPEDYGYNPAVLQRCRPGYDTRAEMMLVRGDAYTEFLRQVKRRTKARGKVLRYHLNMDYFRPDPPPDRAPAYPANLTFDWQRWLDEGLLDAAVLRSYHHRAAMRTDTFGAQMVDACRERNLPVSFNHHVFTGDPWYLEEAKKVAADYRFAGLILYEAHSFLRTKEDGSCYFTLDIAKQICAALRPPPAEPAEEKKEKE